MTKHKDILEEFEDIILKTLSRHATRLGFAGTVDPDPREYLPQRAIDFLIDKLQERDNEWIEALGEMEEAKESRMANINVERNTLRLEVYETMDITDKLRKEVLTKMKVES